jgi:D-alanyl-D-alanine carboxypeptidase
MRRALMIGLVLLLAGCGSSKDNGPARTSSDAGLSKETIAAAKAQLKDWVAKGQAPGVLIQVKTPKGTWTDMAGVSDKASSTPMSPDLQHRIGSVTKTFTAIVILKLVDEGKLALEDPVSKYVDGVPNGDKITIRMLGSMTSGLPEFLANKQFRDAFFADPTKKLVAQDMLAASYSQGIDFAPGANSAYSNTNTVLLGLVAEKVEGKRFSDILNQKILKPDGLKHTLYPDDATFPEKHNSGYSTLDPAHPEIESTSWSPSQANTAGQMISTVPDLTKWAKIAGAGEGLSAALKTERLKWQPLGDNNDEWHYAFGIEVNSGWLGHNGMIPGYMTYEVYNPTIDSSIVLVQNTDKNSGNDPGINALMRDISKTLFPANPVNVPRVGETQ